MDNTQFVLFYEECLISVDSGESFDFPHLFEYFRVIEDLEDIIETDFRRSSPIPFTYTEQTEAYSVYESVVTPLLKKRRI